MRASLRSSATSQRGLSDAVSQRTTRRYFQARGPPPRVVTAQAKGSAPDGPSRPQLTRPKPASAAQVAKALPPAQPVSSAAIAEAYKQAAAAKSRREAVEVKVAGMNEGGLVVQYGPLRGFMPYNQVDPARLRACANGDMAPLMGQLLKARVVNADPSRKELVLSERQVAAAEALSRIQPGEVLTCVVTGVEDYGAFVQVKGSPDVSGLVHRSEVSWGRIMTVDEVVAIGQEVRAKVLSVDLAACRLALSIRQLSADPLRISIDGLAWEDVPEGAQEEGEGLQEGGPQQQGVRGEAARVTEPKVVALLEALRRAPGVDSVAVTRTAQDSHRVAQELEVYLVRGTEGSGEGEYTAVARLGVGAAQLRLRAASLSREQVKQLLARVAMVVAA